VIAKVLSAFDYFLFFFPLCLWVHN
jgi:hypothetical protein